MTRPDDYENPSLYLFRATAVMLMLLLGAAGAIFAETEELTLWTSRVAGVTSLVVLFVLCYGWSFYGIFHGRDRQVLLLLWVMAGLLCVLMAASNEESTYYLSSFWVARTPNSYRLRTCIYLTAGMLVLTISAGLLHGLEWPLWVLLILMPTYMFILSVSYTAVNERRLRYEALTLNRQLQDAQQKLEDASRQSERLRIARDMHDVQGHQLTTLILNLEVAAHQAAEPVLGHVEQSLALARMALGDLRNAVSDLRDYAATDFRAALDSMLTQIPGLQIRVDCDNDLPINDPVTAEALLRCIQEAVTNTLRHANAQRCSISLRQQEGQLLLEVRDDGHCPPHIEPGNGLHGMRERLQQLAGKLHWQKHEGSFLLQANLPLPLPKKSAGMQ